MYKSGWQTGNSNLAPHGINRFTSPLNLWCAVNYILSESTFKSASIEYLELSTLLGARERNPLHRGGALNQQPGSQVL